MKLQYSFFVFLFVCCFSAEAQEFKNFSSEEGLPSNEVYSIFQDKNGSMWFSTDRGLCQYNGYEFKKYEPKDGLTDITVFDFYPQENGQVWCTTFNRKLFYFENGSNRFVPYKYNNCIDAFVKKYNATSFFIKSLAVAKNGVVYISSGASEFSISTTGKLTELTKTEVTYAKRKLLQKIPVFLNGLTINKLQDIHFLSNKKSGYAKLIIPTVLRSITNLTLGRKLIVTENLVEILQKDGKTVKIDFGKFQPVAGGKMDDQHIWVGYRSNGIKIYDLKGKYVKGFLPHATVSNFFRDCYGGFWISTTDYGVYYLAPNSIVQFKMDNNVVQSLTKDNHQNLFIGMYNGDIYKKEKNKKVVLTKKALINFPSYIQFYEGENSIVYGNGDAFYSDYKPVMHLPSRVTRISDDSRSVLSFLQFSSYTIWQNNKFLTNTLNFRIHDISCIGSKTYFGTIEGLKVMENGVIHQKSNPLFKYRIDDIDYVPSKATLFAATLGKGVLVYNISKNEVYAIDKTKGLSSDVVTEVYVENDNTIWACTNYGLNRIRFTSPTTYKIDYLSTANGMVSNQIRDVEIINDSIYVGTSKGLSVISKRQYEQLLSKKYYFLRLKDIYINGNALKENQKQLKLSYRDNQIDFMVEAVSFSERKKIEYQYKLEGLDKEWKTTQERKLSYPYIPPGDYKLMVKVIDDGRIFSNESIVLALHIDKPFWMTYWFFSILGIVFSAIIYFFFKIRVLSYNEDIVRELLRLLLKKIKKKDDYFSFKELGKEIRIKTSEILFVRSSGNYIDIITTEKTYTVRGKIGDFVSLVQDPLEFLRIHRSFIVRIDKVDQKSKKALFIEQHEIPVGETYLDELDKILF
ncbi:MAG: two-component regulator propeller domain-containing protein [Flavobacterium sp.]